MSRHKASFEQIVSGAKLSAILRLVTNEFSAHQFISFEVILLYRMILQELKEKG